MDNSAIYERSFDDGINDGRNDGRNVVKHPYLKKGQGKLASDYHGVTEFSKQRKEKIIREQEERERK